MSKLINHHTEWFKFKGNDNFTCTDWNSGCPLASSVTDDLVLPNQFIAFIATELTGWVVAEGCDGVAAAHATRAEVGVFQIWTLCNYDKQSKYVL